MTPHTPDERFTATSGNSCRIQVETKDCRVAVQALWKREPSEADMREFATHMNAHQARSVVSAKQGGGTAGKARSAFAMRRFLQTGDPGEDLKP